MRRPKSFFYQGPALRYQAFVWGTIAVLIDATLFLATLVRRWAHLPPIVIFLLTLGMIGLLSLWWVVLDRQKFLRGLLGTGRIERPEAGSSLDIALSVASDITEWALFAASISVGALIEALGEISRF